MSILKTITLNLAINEDSLEEAGMNADTFIENIISNIQYQIGRGLLTEGADEVEVDEYTLTDDAPVPELILDINETHFKKSAKRLKSELLDSGLNVGHAKSLQILSKSLYTKPFEEIKATILNGNKNQSQETNNHEVIIVDLG